jgi:hypothetical protein
MDSSNLIGINSIIWVLQLRHLRVPVCVCVHISTILGSNFFAFCTLSSAPLHGSEMYGVLYVLHNVAMALIAAAARAEQ